MKNPLPSLLFTLLCAMHTPALGGYEEEGACAEASTPLEVYEREAVTQAQQQAPTSGALWTPLGQFADLARDLRASQVNDLVTIIVAEQASAVSTGASQATRTSTSAVSITGLAGVKSSTSALANLLNTIQRHCSERRRHNLSHHVADHHYERARYAGLAQRLSGAGRVQRHPD